MCFVSRSARPTRGRSASPPYVRADGCPLVKALYTIRMVRRHVLYDMRCRPGWRASPPGGEAVAGEPAAGESPVAVVPGSSACTHPSHNGPSEASGGAIARMHARRTPLASMRDVAGTGQPTVPLGGTQAALALAQVALLYGLVALASVWPVVFTTLKPCIHGALLIGGVVSGRSGQCRQARRRLPACGRAALEPVPVRPGPACLESPAPPAPPLRPPTSPPTPGCLRPRPCSCPAGPTWPRARRSTAPASGWCSWLPGGHRRWSCMRLSSPRQPGRSCMG